MNFPVATAPRLRAVLKGMPTARALSQAQVGELLGVNQKLAAKIEAAPGVNSFDQITRLVTALLAGLIEQTPGIIERVTSALPNKFPAQIADSILSGLGASAKRLKTEL